MQFVLTLKEVLLANAQLDSMGSHTKVCALLICVVVHLIVNVDRTRNAFNLANAFVHHLSSSKAEAAEILVKGFRVESTLSAVQQTHLNVCVKLVSKVIHSKAAQALTNVPMHHVLMELNVKPKREATNAPALMEWLGTLTKAVACMKTPRQKFNARRTKTVHRIFAAATVTASAHVLIFCVARTLSAILKIMRDGVDAVLDSTKAPTEIACQVSIKSEFQI
jgi:hypothetical protein